jgi:hypothetical protein
MKSLTVRMLSVLYFVFGISLLLPKKWRDK